MNWTDCKEYIDKTALVNLGNGIAYQVKILDAKQVYGRMRFLCKPSAGNGQAWYEKESLTVLVQNMVIKG